MSHKIESMRLANFVLLILSVCRPVTGVAPIAGGNLTDCADDEKFCFDGFTCFKTTEACTSGGCGDCTKWDGDQLEGSYCYKFDYMVTKKLYATLPVGTTFSYSSSSYGSGPNAGMQVATFRYRSGCDWSWDEWDWFCGQRRSAVTARVYCAPGFYPEVEYVSCSDINTNHGPATDIGADFCYNCWSYIAHSTRYCKMCGQWNRMPQCDPGCTLRPLPNGTASILVSTGFKNNVYRSGSTASYSCHSGYYLSTLSPSTTAICTTYNSNFTGNWSVTPACLPACGNITLAFGSVSYSPNMPTYTFPSYLPQTTLAIFNCSTDYYLDPPNYIYNCTGPNWDLGPTTPVCKLGCKNISVANGNVIFTPASNYVNGVYRQGTFATFNCSSGYYLSTLTDFNSTDCNATGLWSHTPTCMPGCPVINYFNGQPVFYNPNVLVNGVYRQNATAIFNCSTGYYLSTLTTINATDCNSAGQWSNVPNCTIGCPPIVNFLHGILPVYTDPITNAVSSLDNLVYRQATIVTFSCQYQYYLSTLTPTTFTYCNGTGLWASSPYCIIGCQVNDTALDIDDGTVSAFETAFVSGLPVNGYLYQADDLVNFTCDSAYCLSSTNPASCNGVTGNWDNIPSCLLSCFVFVNNFTSLTTFSNISYSQSACISNPFVYDEGTIATFACYNGSYLAGPSTAECHNGSWTGDPLCLPGCFNAPNIDNMDTITYTPAVAANEPLHKNGTVARYTCKGLSQLADRDYINCERGNWSYPLPVCKPIPLVLLITKASMTLSCVFLVIAMAIIIVVTIVVKDFSIETCLHLNEEFALMFAHLLILIFRDRVDLTDICPAACAGIQYFITTSFVCMALEALHSYCMLTNVISFGGVWESAKFKNFVVGWFFAMITTGVTICLHYDKYPSPNSCYVNLGDHIAVFIFAPIVAFFLLTIIMTEAAAQGEWKHVPLVCRKQRLAAHINQKAMAPLVILSVASWFFGLLAAYLNDPYFFSFGAVMNMTFGIVMIVFHFVGNPKLNHWFHEKVLKRCCKKKYKN